MIKINLLPRERIRRVAVAPRILVGFVAVIVVAGLVLVTLYLNVQNALLRSELAQVNTRIDELRPQVAEVEALQRQINEARRKEQLLRQIQAMRIPWERVMNELRKTLPTDVWLNRVDAKGDGTLTFEGFGLSYESVARFMVSLNSSPVFMNADFRSGHKTSVANHDVISFAVTVQLAPPGKAAALP
jgi:type IV pilus assembly protein PilN